MPEYTVGEVAGVINVALTFVQFTMPLLQVVVLAGFLRSKNSAATWLILSALSSPTISIDLTTPIRTRSMASRFVQSSTWPTLLSCDSTTGRAGAVKKSLLIIVYAALFSTLMVAAAGIITPIGLGKSLQMGKSVSAIFEYAIDPSVFGEGTPRRDNYTTCRVCYSGALACPGVDTINQLPGTNQYSSAGGLMYVPKNTTDCFSSGTKETGDLRSNPFEIQFRKYWTPTPKPATALEANTTGDFSMLESIVLLDKFDVREGLVIDAVNGGLGFRNHTVPTDPPMKSGGTWTEDLLWIEPVTVCVDTNWTFLFQVQLTPFYDTPEDDFTVMKLINRGFLNTYGQSPPDMSINEPDPQENLDLRGRANVAAQKFGSTLSRLLYLTSSNGSVGMTYTIDSSNSYVFFAFDRFGGTSSPGLLLGPLLDISLVENDLDPILSSVLTPCQDYGPGIEPTIDQPRVQCGFVMPPPVPSSGNFVTTDFDETQSQSIQICASSLRATIKETSFRYTDTGGIPSLIGLEAIDVRQKNYSTKSAEPVWGVENPGPNWNISAIQLLWGIVDQERYQNSSGLWTVQSDHLYLPASYPASYAVSFDAPPSSQGDSMGGSRGPGLAMAITYLATQGYDGLPSYDGTVNGRMLLKWQKLASSVSGTAKIPNLIWTDIAANLLVGTKSLTEALPLTRAYQVQTYERRITYQYVWGILGFLSCTLWAAWALALIVILLIPKWRSRITPGALKALINRLSVGRALAAAEQPDCCDREAPTIEWLSKAGRIEIELWKSGEGNEELLDESSSTFELLNQFSSNRYTGQWSQRLLNNT